MQTSVHEIRSYYLQIFTPNVITPKDVSGAFDDFSGVC